MSEDALRITPVTPAIGGLVSGLDLASPLPDARIETLRRALQTHQVLFFRSQRMTLDQHTALGRRFGELHVHPAAPKGDEHPEVLVVHADARSTFVPGDLWHSDVSCDVEPPMASILRIEQLPPAGGDTLFASMYAAYEALSDRMQRLLGELTAIHDGRQYYVGRYGDAHLRDATYPSAEHPALRTHPETGRTAIYVNEGFTTGFKELTRAESDALLAFLVRHCAAPEFHCRFRWEADSVAFWDNRCTQHLAIWDYYPQTRHGYRVTIKGDRPFYRREGRPHER